MSKIQFITNSPVVSQYVASRVGESADDFGPHSNIGVVRNGRAVCGVVFNWYRDLKYGGDVRVTIAAESGVPWATKEVLEVLFAYPFEGLNCNRITAIIREGNVKSERFCKALGFKKEGVIRQGYNGRTNAFVYGLLKKECRYLDGQKRGQRSAAA